MWTGSTVFCIDDDYQRHCRNRGFRHHAWRTDDPDAVFNRSGKKPGDLWGNTFGNLYHLTYRCTGDDIFAKEVFSGETKRYQTTENVDSKRRKSGKQIRKYTDWDWWDSGCTDIGSRSVRHDE